MKRTLPLLTLCSFETMLVIAFATGAALAQETEPSFEIASPPACQNNKGELVRFENQLSSKAKSAAGMARRDDKGRAGYLPVCLCEITAIITKIY